MLVYLILPFGVPLVWAATHHARTRNMPAAFIAVVAATAGIIVWSWGIVSATGDPVWVPLLFVPALALLPVVIYTGRARVWLAVVAWFPIIGGIAHGTGIVVIMTCG